MKYNKLLRVFALLLILTTIFSCSTVLAEDTNDTGEDTSQSADDTGDEATGDDTDEASDEPVNTDVYGTLDPEDFDLNAAMLIDGHTGTILYSQDADERIYPASTTKILTALVVLDRLDFGDTIVVPDQAVSGFTSASSLMHLKTGETISVKDVFYGMMLESGNDAAYALAYEISGGIEEFAVLMNEKAQELGMTDSNFVNPHGVQHEDHYTTASDMSILALAALENEQLTEVMSTKKYIVDPTDKVSHERTMINTNRLLTTSENNTEEEQGFLYPYATGMKTGTTNAAGRCLVASAEKEGRTLIALIYGDYAEDALSFSYAEKLLDYGYETSHNVTVKEFLTAYPVTTLVNGAAEGDETLECVPDIGEDEMITMMSGSEITDEMNINKVVNSAISAPVDKGEVIGSVTYTMGDRVLYDGPLLAGRDVYQPGAGGVDGPISVLEPVKLKEENEQTNADQLMMLWLVIPAGIIALLILRMAVVKKRVGAKNRKKSSSQMRQSKTQYKRVRYRKR